ncbi:nucleotidyltransferase domain-containing protein [Providencia burhodogranariea]|uniref:Polymerase nucleotidyl transferase domain-containing protein n=1 Tax=Providencia burhodogranariea DSM 19968 TaxID=1141662 RepID=K8WKX9_9GAMM|nr:nucleotidyltransferase domain-containing protein [Providencia burhodogranariea]EKT58132.1 hypothetical protein OOA_13437 [Providencia burhodogranariea DSM 19968]
MTLNSTKFIKTLPSGQFQSEFQKVINDVENSLVLALGSQLHSVYLYGSVAKGCATAGISDLDVCVILTEKPDSHLINIIADIRKVIMSSHKVVSKVDFDIGSLSEVLDPEKLYSWGYWLKHHCRCIFGDDLACRFNLFKPSKAIAIAVNGDFIEAIDGYVHSLSNISDEIERKQLQRSAARKLIRSTNLLRANEDVDWPEALEEYVVKFSAQYPMRENEIRYFLSQSHMPTDGLEAFIKRLNNFTKWLVTEVKSDSYH